MAFPGPFLSPHAAPFYPRRSLGTEAADEQMARQPSDVSMLDWNASKVNKIEDIAACILAGRDRSSGDLSSGMLLAECMLAHNLSFASWFGPCYHTSLKWSSTPANNHCLMLHVLQPVHAARSTYASMCALDSCYRK